MPNNKRPVVPADQIENAVERLHEELNRRLAEKGHGAFVSTHEILGIIDEEHYEAKLAVHANDPDLLVQELFDIAVGCVFGAACIKSGFIDW